MKKLLAWVLGLLRPSKTRRSDTPLKEIKSVVRIIATQEPAKTPEQIEEEYRAIRAAYFAKPEPETVTINGIMFRYVEAKPGQATGTYEVIGVDGVMFPEGNP